MAGRGAPGERRGESEEGGSKWAAATSTRWSLSERAGPSKAAAAAVDVDVDVVNVDDDGMDDGLQDTEHDLQILAVKTRVPSGPPVTPKPRQMVDLTVDSPEPFDLTTVNLSSPPQPQRSATGNSRDVLRCSICLDSVSHPTSTICGHLFCEACIRLAVRQTGLCPTCRRKLSIRQVHRVYL